MVELICALAASSSPQAWVDRRLHLIAGDVEIEPALPERLLRLADGGIFAAALVDRDRELAGERALTMSPAR